MVQIAGLSLNIMLLAAAWWATRAVSPRQGVGSQFLTASTLAWGWCILGMQFLGSLSLLNLVGMALWFAVGSAIALASGWYLHKDSDSQTDFDPRLKDRFSWPSVLCVGFLVWVCLEMALQSLLYPVKVMSDGPIYHLYFAVRWWKAAKFFLIAAPFGENAATYFPANGDLWFTWLMIAWDGDRLARIGQAPFLILAGVSAYQISRMLGAGRSSSIIAATWFLTSTPLLVFSFEANVDTIFIANDLLATYFFLRFARGEGGTSSLLFGGLAAGGALGTKSVAMVFVPPLILLAIGAVLWRPGSRREKIARILTLALSPLILSGYWYSRNAILTGNPLYPLRLELFGHRILSGWYGRGAMEQSQYYIPITDWRALGDILLSVLDPRLTPVWLLAACGIWAIPRPPRPAEWKWVGMLGSMAIVNIVLYWLFIPYRTQQRFMLHALGLAVAPLAQTFERGKWVRAIASFLLILHVVTPQTWPIVVRPDQPIPWDLTPMIPNFLAPPLSLFSALTRSLSGPQGLLSAFNLAVPIALGLLSIFVAWSWMRRVFEPRPGRLAVPLANSALLAVVGYFASTPGQVSPKQLFYPPFRDFYVGWMNFDAASGPRGSRVAYAGTNIPYYLFGTGLRNDVRYINVDGHRDWLLHDYHRLSTSRGREVWPNPRPGWDRERPDYPSWIANLEAERIKLLVVTRVNRDEGAHNVNDEEGFPIERQWADMHPERFRLLHGANPRDPEFRIYEFLRP